MRDAWLLCCRCLGKSATPGAVAPPVAAPAAAPAIAPPAAAPAVAHKTPPRDPIDGAAMTIQRYFATDPITLVRICGPRVVLVRHGVERAFEARTLHRYIVHTGDLCDPVARVRYSRVEMQRLILASGRPLPLPVDVMLDGMSAAAVASAFLLRRRLWVELLASRCRVAD